MLPEVEGVSCCSGQTIAGSSPETMRSASLGDIVGKSAETLAEGGDGRSVEGSGTVIKGCDVAVTADVLAGRVAVEVRRGRSDREVADRDSASELEVEETSIVPIGARRCAFLTLRWEAHLPQFLKVWPQQPHRILGVSFCRH